MPYDVNNIVRFNLKWKNESFGTVYRNVLNFRGHAGELAIDSGPALLDTFVTTWMQRLFNHQLNSTSLVEIRMFNVSQPLDPAEVKTYDQEDYQGSLIATGDEHPQASACVVRQTYSRGRKSIGRFFFGPLCASFCDKGDVVVDPAVAGDLNDVLDALGDPLVHAGYTLRPIVCSAKDTIGNARMDCRTHRMSKRIVFMKSRRVGDGE